MAEWFPKRERALATGIFNSGSNVGAVITPLLVPWITITYGWDWAFIVTGAIGGMLIAKIVGYVLQWSGSYLPIFCIAGAMYLIALLALHGLSPRLTPAAVD